VEGNEFASFVTWRVREGRGEGEGRERGKEGGKEGGRGRKEGIPQ
jgi:hypothetical protein